MTEGYILLQRAVRPEVKKYIPRSEVDHLSITTDKEVVFLYNFRFTPPPRHLSYRCIILLSVVYNPASITLNTSQITGLISIIAIFSN